MAKDNKPKKLTDKQRMAIELMTSGKGYKYKEICEQLEIDVKTLWNWRNSSDFSHFQEELERVNNERWMATIDVAREGALALCKDGNQKMIEFVLRNAGFNPTNQHKVEADVTNEIVINIE